MTALAVLGLCGNGGVNMGRSTASGDAGSNPATPASPGSPMTDTNAGPLQVVPPAQVNLPPELTEIVRLAQSGVDDSVVLAYVRQSPVSSPPTAEQIVYLRDVGVSSDVLQALVEHDSGANSAAGSATASAGAPPPAPEPAPASLASNYYYDALAPYGSWAYFPDYGWCWQPTVAVANPGWQPYCNEGSWYWSDWGWYWNSYYAWGWAPFHYGRWFCRPHFGWAWCPDRVWGPAWVSWRNGPSFCGWAPLPPGACFTSGIGWTFNGLAVGVNFGFGLGPSCFTFVGFNHFCDRRFFSHRRFDGDRDDFFRRSRVENDFVAGPDHRIINRGIDRQRIAAATQSPIREVAVRELPRGTTRAALPDRLERAGNGLVVYRPGPQTAVLRNPALNTLNRRPELPQSTRPSAVSRSFNNRNDARGGSALLAPRDQGGRWTGSADRSVPARPEGRIESGRSLRGATASPGPDTGSRPTRSYSTHDPGRPQSMNEGRSFLNGAYPGSYLRGSADRTWAPPTPVPGRYRSYNPGTIAEFRNYNAPARDRIAPSTGSRSESSWRQAPAWSGSRAPASSPGRFWGSSGRSAPSFGSPAPSRSGGGSRTSGRGFGRN